jgi:transcriptional regulator with XRE-family HTH domain
MLSETLNKEPGACPPALLSKIETGRMFPTLPALQRIALVFGAGLDHFFVREDSPEPAVVRRRKERIRFPDRADSRSASFEFESLDFKVLNRPLSGKLGLQVAGNEILLERSDSVCFDASHAHAYRRIGKANCAPVIVTVPGSDLPAPLSAPGPARVFHPPKASGGSKQPSPRSGSSCRSSA